MSKLGVGQEGRVKTKSEVALEGLRPWLEELERTTGAQAISVALHDEESKVSFFYHADRWFHAASTIKLAILAGVYSAIHRGVLKPHDRLHVRNRFHGAIDGLPFRVRADRDSSPAVHSATGKTMQVCTLARHMIVTSSNLAANLLLDIVGLSEVQAALDHINVKGVDIVRGVEDERAWEAGMNNRVTARGLLHLLRTIAEEHAFSREASQQMLEIMHAQEFRSGIPGRLPREVRVANKTGSISTIAHDAGIVFVPGRKPYVLVVLTAWPTEGAGRSEIIATISHEIYVMLTGNSGLNGDAGNG